MQLLTSCLPQYKKRQLSFPVAHSQMPALQAETEPVALDNWCLVLACAGPCSVPPGMVLQGLQHCSAFLLCWVVFSEVCGNVGSCSCAQIVVPLRISALEDFGSQIPWQEPVATWLSGRQGTPGHKPSWYPEAEPSRLTL